ncbi:toxin-activating lysine-acyltransferase [Methylibium rhizosphaerae]|uniref:toxin-activating lysine-acyltransferase n=1 Tax=Methylibium rhizosphaerae TaxID=2570323 RepID=UPI0011296D58|nr:toxin-activating lysine-acyltransferase [Methylibium rhizosphaerae]
MNTPQQPTFDNPAAQLEAAKKELAKLPLLGPALWLYSRDAQRRFTFLADIDWRLMPPLVLDQCRLFSKVELPWAFVTWAFVSDAVDQRLRSTAPIIAPHEWKSGANPWLIDVVAPFGDAESVAKETIAAVAPGQTVHAWLVNPQGQPVLKEFRPHG